MTTTTNERAEYSSGNGVNIEIGSNEKKLGFIIYNKDNDSCSFTETIGFTLPKHPVPWLSSEMPIDYGADYALYKEVLNFIQDHVELPKEDDYHVLAACLLPLGCAAAGDQDIPLAGTFLLIWEQIRLEHDYIVDKQLFEPTEPFIKNFLDLKQNFKLGRIFLVNLEARKLLPYYERALKRRMN